jgi:hypothetical protein
MGQIPQELEQAIPWETINAGVNYFPDGICPDCRSQKYKSDKDVWYWDYDAVRGDILTRSPMFRCECTEKRQEVNHV